MANFFVRSTDGSDSDNGSTWALAKATVAGALAVAGAGDTIFVSKNHAETQAASLTWTSAGTLAAPVSILCVDDAGNPASPTTLAATASVTTTGLSSISFNASLFVYGVNFNMGTGSSGSVRYNFHASTSYGGARQEFESCAFRVTTTSPSGGMSFGVTSGSPVGSECLWTNCTVKFAQASQKFLLGAVTFAWVGGGIESGGTAPTTGLFQGLSGGRQDFVLCRGVDFTELGANPVFLAERALNGSRLVSCRMAAGWSLLTGSWNGPARVRADNCDSDPTNYRLWIEESFGAIRDDTTHVLSGGASDGTTPIAYAMISNTAAGFVMGRLASPELLVWIDTTGASKTVTVQILVDSATALTDREVWLEAAYAGTSAAPITATASDRAASLLGAGAAQATGSGSWTTTGLANPRLHALQVAFTNQLKGWVVLKVMLAKPSTTIYVDPKPQVS